LKTEHTFSLRLVFARFVVRFLIAFAAIVRRDFRLLRGAGNGTDDRTRGRAFRGAKASRKFCAGAASPLDGSQDCSTRRGR
jgi:hypothetical protein